MMTLSKRALLRMTWGYTAATMFLLLGSGCAPQGPVSDGSRGGSLVLLAPPTGDLRVGPTVMITAQVDSAAGRSTEIRWTTTGGRLNTMADGRTVGITFEEAGRFVLKAELYVDGRLADVERLTLDVEPAADPY